MGITILLFHKKYGVLYFKRVKMNKILNINRQVLLFGIPLLMLLVILIISKSAVFINHTNTLSIGITIDLLLTIPLVYLVLVRKTSIPKNTVVLVIIIGVLIGSVILPVENQYYLNIFKTWGLPLIELFALGLIAIKFRTGIKEYKINRKATPDFYTALKDVTQNLFPNKIAVLFATEVAVIYYGFVQWKKKKLKSYEFTYHKESPAISLLVVLIFMTLIETSVFHILLAKWNTTAAWLLSGLSIYMAIQVFAIIRSIIKRPISVEKKSLELRYGILNETSIDYKDIDSIMVFTNFIHKEDNIRKLSPLGALENHNILITLKKEYTLIGLYGIKKTFTKLAFHVDKQDEFLGLIKKEVERKVL